LAVVGVIAALALTGCSVPHHSQPGSASTLSPNAVTASPAAPAPTAKPAAPPPPPPPPPPPSVDPCQSNVLKITYTATDSTAGHTHGVLLFKNVSAAPCDTSGWPTVYFYSMTGTYKDIGSKSQDDHTTIPGVITVQPGGTFSALTTITDGTLVEGCTVVTVQNLDVTPPGGDSSWIVSDPDQTACSNSVALIAVQPAVG
jgi:Protein of unknown function (DUF4232)